MKIIKIIYQFLLLVGASWLLTDCNSKMPSSSTYGETAFISGKPATTVSGEEPLTLKLVVNDTYCEQTACACIHHLAARSYDEVVSLLKINFNIDLQLVYCIEEFDLEDSIKSNRYDGAICKPWLAFRHVPSGGMKFTRVADLVDPFENTLLSGIFIVKKESLLQKPSDINGKILAMGQDDSYEKYHLPMTLMKKEGVTPAKMVNKSSCTEGINLLLDNQADVAVVSDYALFASCAVDIAEEDAFRTIWKTEDIPLCSVILDLKKVGEADAMRLQNALLKISGDRIAESFKSKGFEKPVSWMPDPF